MHEYQERTAYLLGESGMEKLQNAYVAIIGLGGVGGHCAEALARAGVGRLHLVDGDRVDATNLNRQIVAEKSTIGMEKTAAMAKRIQAVSDCIVTVKQGFVLPENVEEFLPENLTFLVDAVDTVSAKLALAKAAADRGLPIISCMGAGNRLDPSGFYVTDVFSTAGCGLARAMRQGLRKGGIAALPVVCSKEPARTPKMQPEERETGRRQTPGSLSCVTAAAGLTIAGYVIRKIAIDE